MRVQFVMYGRTDEPLGVFEMAQVPRRQEVVELPWIGDKTGLHRYQVHHVRWHPLGGDYDAVVILTR